MSDDDSERYDSPWRGGLPSVVRTTDKLPNELVIADILSRDPRWDLSVGSARHIRDRVCADLSELHFRNSADVMRNAYASALDTAVYLRGCLAKTDESSLAYPVLFEVYDDAVTALTRLKRVLMARDIDRVNGITE